MVCVMENLWLLLGTLAVGALKVFVFNLCMIYLDYWILSLIVNAKCCSFPKGVSWVRYRGVYKDLNINLIWPGKDLTLGRYLILLCVCECVCIKLCFFESFFK
jgi:hypothetical protein